MKDELITKGQAIKQIQRYGVGCFDADDFIPEQAERFVINKIKELQPIQPKTGHWERISIDKYSEHAKYWYRCDRCGKDNLGNTDWCPNCGAKMIESQESEG